MLRARLQAKFTKDEGGACMGEDILLVALDALALKDAVVFLRGQVQDKIHDAGTKLSEAGTP